jgi:hypothetical protein
MTSFTEPERATLESAHARADETSAPPAEAMGRYRAMIAIGCVVAAAAAFAIGSPDRQLAADPDLARLLRAMGLIKGALVLAGVWVIAMRFRWPVTALAAAGYMTAAWSAAFAAGLIWQLSFIPQAALLFHVAAIAAVVIAWRDGARTRWQRSTPRGS